ncbi:MAG: carboxypeptidase-like regulatory domain-containing protein, partial [Ginsengibacter sp.]
MTVKNRAGNWVNLDIRSVLILLASFLMLPSAKAFSSDGRVHSETAISKSYESFAAITGTVTDSKGNPLQGVTVLVKGSKNGTSTDESGHFSLEAPENGTLIVSIVGYTTQQVPVNNRRNIDIVLVSANSELNEVVVIGYGTAKKKDLTGAVTSVSSARLVDKPVTNLGQALENKVAGVQVIS